MGYRHGSLVLCGKLPSISLVMYRRLKADNNEGPDIKKVEKGAKTINFRGGNIYKPMKYEAKKRLFTYADE